MHAMSVDDVYRVQRVLGSGALGVTELVTIDGTGPFVRKKIPHDQARRDVWAAVAECRCRLVPRVWATYEMPEHFVVVCDYVPGEALSARVSGQGRLSIAEAGRIALDVCDAASELHAHAVIHRDISPRNVIVASDGAHLIDFGIAKVEDGDVSRDAETFGTWGFAAPEQYGFAQTDARSDVYSIGRLLGYMLTGVMPDDEEFERALADEAIVGRTLREVIMRACAFEPSARYQSARQLASAIEAALGDANADAARAAAAPASALVAGPSPSARPTYADAAPGVDAAASMHGEADAAGGATSMGVAIDSDARVGAMGAAAGTGTATRAGARADAAAGAAAGIGAAASDGDAPAEASRARRRRAALIAAGVAVAAVLAACAAFALAGGAPFGREDAASGGDVADVGTESGEDADNSAVGLGGAAGAAGGDAARDLPGADATAALAVSESGWSADAAGYVNYAFCLANSSDTADIDFPEVVITGRDAQGSVVFSDTQVLPHIAAGQALYFAGVAGNGTAPHSVEFSAVAPDEWNVDASDAAQDVGAAADGAAGAILSCSDVSVVAGDFGRVSFTGEVTARSSADASAAGSQSDASSGGIAVSVILRDGDGNIIYGTTVFADMPAEGRPVAFEASAHDVPAYATVEAYAQPW